MKSALGGFFFLGKSVKLAFKDFSGKEKKAKRFFTI
jgi:hypothetical protein